MALGTATPSEAAPGPRSDQWWFSAWQIQQRVWPITKGAGVTVAVVDNGVNGQIPDLRGAVVPGTNAETGSGDGQIPATTDFDAAHGTAMAALIVGQGAGTGYLGVAPEAKVMSINSNLAVWDKGIRWATDHGAKVISISQAFAARRGCRPELQAAVAYALQHDVVVLAGAGNDGDKANLPMEPANCAGVLAVGAVDNKKVPWSGTQRQPYVEVAAPGFLVNTVDASGKINDRVAGTSQATALASGVAALIRSKNPQMPAREVVQRMINTTKDAGPPGKDNMTGTGVLIPGDALTANVPKSAPNPVFAAYDRWVAANPQQGGQPAATPSAKHSKSASTKRDDQADQNTKILLGAIAGVAVIAAIVIGFMVMRNRKKPKAFPAGGGYAPQQGNVPGPPPGWGGHSGPPQGPQGTGRPYPPPPGQGGRGPN